MKRNSSIFKKLFCVIMSLGLVVGGTINILAQPTIEVDLDKQEVYINGVTEKGEANKQVSLQLLRPGMSIEDVDANTPDTLVPAFAYLDFATTGIGGSYQFTIQPEGLTTADGSGYYTARIGVQGSTELSVSTFHFSDASSVATSLGEINDALVATIDAGKKTRLAINKNKEILHLQYEPYEMLNEAGEIKVGDALEQDYSSFRNITELFSAFKLVSIVQAFNDAEDEQVINDLMIEYDDVLQLKSLQPYITYINNTNEKAGKLDNDDRVSVRNSLVAGNYANVDKIREAFMTLVIAKAIKVSTFGEIPYILENNKDILLLDNYGLSKYKQLRDTINVDKALAGKSFESIQKIQEAFETAVDAVDSNGDLLKNEESPRGGDSSKGRVSNITVSNPVVTTPNATPTPNPEKIFDDLDNVPWAEESIKALALKGVVTGKGAKVFAPEDKVTREEFIKMIITAFDLVDMSATTDFIDVNSGEWYYSYVASAQKLGITQGTPDNRFGTKREITRQDLAVLANRAALQMKVELPKGNPVVDFKDAADIESYAVESIAAMQQAGIVNGMGDGRFAPNDPCTRAQAARILYGLLKAAGRI